jgi:hypothetical protein
VTIDSVAIAMQDWFFGTPLNVHSAVAICHGGIDV